MVIIFLKSIITVWGLLAKNTVSIVNGNLTVYQISRIAALQKDVKISYLMISMIMWDSLVKLCDVEDCLIISGCSGEKQSSKECVEASDSLW